MLLLDAEIIGVLTDLSFVPPPGLSLLSSGQESVLSCSFFLCLPSRVPIFPKKNSGNSGRDGRRETEESITTAVMNGNESAVLISSSFSLRTLLIFPPAVFNSFLVYWRLGFTRLLLGYSSSIVVPRHELESSSQTISFQGLLMNGAPVVFHSFISSPWTNSQLPGVGQLAVLYQMLSTPRSWGRKDVLRIGKEMAWQMHPVPIRVRVQRTRELGPIIKRNGSPVSQLSETNRHHQPVSISNTVDGCREETKETSGPTAYRS